MGLNSNVALKVGEAGVALEIDEIVPLCTPLCSVHVSEPNNEYIKKWLFDFLLENLGMTQSIGRIVIHLWRVCMFVL